MKKFKFPFILALIVLNSIVLLGQIMPEGAPPFAKIVNILTLILNILFLFLIFIKFINRKKEIQD